MFACQSSSTCYCRRVHCHVTDAKGFVLASCLLGIWQHGYQPAGWQCQIQLLTSAAICNAIAVDPGSQRRTVESSTDRAGSITQTNRDWLRQREPIDCEQHLYDVPQQGPRLSLMMITQAIVVGSQSFALHPPIAQERLDVFTQSKQGCVQVGQIHQKAVVKVLLFTPFCPVPHPALLLPEFNSCALQRATMQALSKQPVAAQASQAQQTGPPHIAHRPAAGKSLLKSVCLEFRLLWQAIHCEQFA